MSDQQGDVWAVPPMPREQWEDQSFEVWCAVERALIGGGWGGKLSDAYRLVTGHEPSELLGSMYPDVAIKAAELGAPVPQMFTAFVMRARRH